MNTYGSSTAVPMELDFLVNTLRNPGPSITSNNVLGYMYNYLPYLKHEHNLKVIFSSFLNNSVCFGPNPATFAENYLIVEVFKLIFDKKLKVSEPTLSVKIFYSVIERELCNFVAFNPPQNSWKVLPIIAGLSLSNGLRDELLTRQNFLEYKWFFSEFDKAMDSLFKRSFQHTLADSTPRDISSLALVSLALKYSSEQDLNEYLGPLSKTLLIRQLMDLVFGAGGGARSYLAFAETGPDAPDVEQFLLAKVWQNPVVKHINRLSFLLELLFRELPLDAVSSRTVVGSVALLRDLSHQINGFAANSSLNRSSDQLSENDVYEQNFWLLGKRIFFSQVTVFQGIVSRFLISQKSGFWAIFSGKHASMVEREYQEICYVLLECLHYMHFVLISIGQGGFDGYNYIYYVSLEILLRNNSNRSFEYFTRRLIQNSREIDLSHGALNHDYVSRSKCLFIFGLWENYFQESQDKEDLFVRYVCSIVFDMVSDPVVSETLLVEGCHSVLLAFFSKSDTHHNSRQVHEYFELLVSQFPEKLSAHQLSVAVETLGKKILGRPVAYPDGYFQNSADEFLDFVHFKCSSTTPGQKIQQHKSSTFASAQPVSEIDASSTMSQLNKSPENNIVEQNKHKKPKDMAFVKVAVAGTDSKRHPEDPQSEFTVREVPATVREGMVLALLNVVPYLPLSRFTHWLEKIWGVIASSNQDEQRFLFGKFWTVLSENLDLNRSEIAHVWWYETKQAAVSPPHAKL